MWCGALTLPIRFTCGSCGMTLGVSLVLTADRCSAWSGLCGWALPAPPCCRRIPTPAIPPSASGSGLWAPRAGCGAFFLLYLTTPEAFHPLMGPLGGLCLGFCTDYRYKTAMNCFGALMLGAGIYGLQGAVILRMVDTFLGVSFGLVFAAPLPPAGSRPAPAPAGRRMTGDLCNSFLTFLPDALRLRFKWVILLY